ncbi:hypothetical protein ACFLYU_05025 [Candidatus Dependentiae bacterium]
MACKVYLKLSKSNRCFVLFPILFLFIFSCLSYAHEFLYPVASIEHNGKIAVYVLYQKSVTHIELWLWDPESKKASKGLLSSYVPAGLKVLPAHDGFSFIDEGRIRIKTFNRRSPKSIDIYEPIYDINEVHWIDDANFYVSAKQDGRFAVFHVHSSGLIKGILQDKVYDFMYPQKVGNTLFYIERKIKEGEYKKEHISYKIAQANYPPLEDYLENVICSINQDNKDDFEKKAKTISAYTQKTIDMESVYIVDFKASPIAFLTMISEDEGFFLEHPENIDRHDETITFNCYHIKNQNYIKKQSNTNPNSSPKNITKKNTSNYLSDWSCKEIFSFSIPSYLILDLLNFCLYESILPLLPRYYNKGIYYADCSPKRAQNLNLFCYNFDTGVSKQKSFAKPQQLMFSPVFTKNGIFYGGKIENIHNADHYMGAYPRMWIDDAGSVCIDLPQIPSTR